LTPRDPTDALEAHTRGDPQAASELLPLVYDNLRARAGKYMQAERPGHTLQPTALVHEAYVRMIDITRIDWQGKTHFFAMAATQMRRLLVEHARARGAQKRAVDKMTLDENVDFATDPNLDVLALDEALTKLSAESDRQCRVAELRFFAGLSVEETAQALGVSERTVKQDWRFARVWLLRELEQSPPPETST
jgi:RNA polymerase sigma factor (TIGR02999 family)